METTVTKNLMTEGSIWKKITFFALPIFLGNLFQQMYNTADSLIGGGQFFRKSYFSDDWIF